MTAPWQGAAPGAEGDPTVLTIDGGTMTSLVAGLLQRATACRVRVAGGSMAPCIRNGDTILLSRRRARRPRLGEVVAFAHPDTGRLLVHRVVKRTGNVCVTQGDNRTMRDGDVPPDALLADVTAIERRGCAVRFGLGPERVLIALRPRRLRVADALKPLRLLCRRRARGREDTACAG